jgi:hypothetical protein
MCWVEGWNPAISNRTMREKILKILFLKFCRKFLKFCQEIWPAMKQKQFIKKCSLFLAWLVRSLRQRQRYALLASRHLNYRLIDFNYPLANCY